MHSYQHNIKTFNNATRHLTRVERALYRDLIELYYDTELPLTSDMNRLCRLVIATTEEEKAALIYVLSEFFELTGTVYTHDYCDEQIAKYKQALTAKSAAGIASANAKKQRADTRKAERTTQPQQNSTGVEHACNEIQLTNNHKPITNNHKPKREKPLPAVAGRSPAGSRIPDDWIPDVLFAVSEGFTEFEARLEGEKFKDYWSSQPGQKGRKTDWHATWRNWIRRAGENKPSPAKIRQDDFITRHTDRSWAEGL